MVTIETENFENRSKIASFDLDWTIIKPKGDTKFPKDENDWMIFPNIQLYIREKYEKDYCIVIFTNQKNIDFQKFKTKIENISKLLKVPLLVYVSMKDDIYRKPLTGMWDLLNDRIRNINIDESFYIGDAAGRRRDFSDSDYKFALNIGIKFYAAYHGYIDFKTDKNVLIPKHPIRDIYHDIQASYVPDCHDKEMIILVGPPACSKSTWSEDYVKKHPNYIIACQDDIGTKSKLLKYILSEIKNEHSIIIDRKNEYFKDRKEFIDIARNSNMKVRILFFDVPKEIIYHLNKYRQITTGKSIPNVVFNKYYSKKRGVGLEIPNEIENIDDIIIMNFIVSEEKLKDKKLFFSYLS